MNKLTYDRRSKLNNSLSNHLTNSVKETVRQVRFSVNKNEILCIDDE